MTTRRTCPQRDIRRRTSMTGLALSTNVFNIGKVRKRRRRYLQRINTKGSSLCRERGGHTSVCPGWGEASSLTGMTYRDRGTSPAYEGKPKKELSSFVSSIRKISSISSCNLSLIPVDAKATLCYKVLTGMIHRVLDDSIPKKSRMR